MAAGQPYIYVIAQHSRRFVAALRAPKEMRPHLVHLTPRIRHSHAQHVPGPFWKRAGSVRKRA